MVAEFNRDAREAGVSPEKMIALQGDLLAETIPADLMKPGLFDFDLVVISAALHHFADPGLAMKRLSSRLKKGGFFLIIDLVPDGDAMRRFHNHHPDTAATVAKNGFSKDEMRKLYEDAGVNVQFSYIVLEKPFEFIKDGCSYKPVFFMARGKRI
jgi:SAM-dependent methyltransferase